MTAPLRFCRAEVRPSERQLLVDGRPVSLGARAFDVLLALVERRDRIVAKNELLDSVWPGLVVEENNLQVQISTPRNIGARGHRYLRSAPEQPAGRAATAVWPRRGSAGAGRPYRVAQACDRRWRRRHRQDGIGAGARPPAARIP